MITHMNEKPKLGIRQQILAAKTASEVQQLLHKLTSFKQAHPSTVRKCERAAKAKLETFK